MKYLDDLLDSITMYRLVLYALGGYIILGLVFAFMGKLVYTPTEMILSLALILTPAYILNLGLGRLFRVPTNSETWLITALILFLIIRPADSLPTALGLVLAGGLASASKFLLTWNNKHIFNPAAFSAAFVSLVGIQATIWWIGNSAFWPFTLLIGLAVVRKIRRGSLFVVFVAVAALLQLLLLVVQHHPVLIGMKGALIASPLLFLSTIMLTEPATMPPRRSQQIIFGALVAALYVTSWKLGPFNISAEVALLLGNVYAFVVSPKLRVRMQLVQIQQISDRVYNYVFQPDRRFNFIPGQYMEWTLAGVPYDSRGNRRTFTIASSPTEETVQVGLKYYQPASAFKATFSQMKLGDSIYASQLAGNFTIDPNASSKLAFIAGGIGITPFRSIIKYLSDNNIERDIVLLYVVSDPNELAYRKEFVEAAKVGVRFIPIVTQPGLNSQGAVNVKLSQNVLAKLVSDYSERTFYISGPSTMVDATRQYLHNLNVKRSDIKTDHFSGY